MSRLPSLGPRGEGWVALQFTLIGAILAACWFTGGAWSVAILTVLGLALVVTGLAIALFGVLGLSTSFAVLPHPAPGARLVTSGLYRYTRNPIYLGLIGAMLGASLGSASLLALLLTGVLAVVLDLKTRREEIYLRGQFPEYDAYAARTKRFVPGLY